MLKPLGWAVAAVLGTAGAVGAVLLEPRGGPRRRAMVKRTGEAVVRRERAHVAAMLGRGRPDSRGGDHLP